MISFLTKVSLTTWTFSTDDGSVIGDSSNDSSIMGEWFCMCSREDAIFSRTFTLSRTFGASLPPARFRHLSARTLRVFGHLPGPNARSIERLHSPIARSRVKPLILKTPWLIANWIVRPSISMFLNSTREQYLICFASFEASNDIPSWHNGETRLALRLPAALGSPYSTSMFCFESLLFFLFFFVASWISYHVLSFNPLDCDTMDRSSSSSTVV
mmetsp:Transcript_289/g.324  ORF Transcript_289/g.324 Transcript_289/m.324 type:complete len:214 (+) Transcript_289:2487-3128(+)